METYPYIGEISHGTMRPQDLLPNFLNLLAEVKSDEFIENLVKESPILDTLKDMEDDDPWWDSEECSYILNEDVWDALQEIAPPYCYFGSSEGDGSSFGFWPSVETIQDDLGDGFVDSVENIPQYAVDVNDHGNMTLYEVQYKEIWSIV